MAQSNISLNNVPNTFNNGLITNYLEPGVIKALVLVPKGTSIPAAQMVSNSTFDTYVKGKFINDADASRWQCIDMLDKFTDETKKTATEDTGLYQADVHEYNPKYSFLYRRSFGNWLEILKTRNGQYLYDYYFIDESGTWDGWKDGTGVLKAYTPFQIYAKNIGRRSDKEANQYMLSVQVSDAKQYNDYFGSYAANGNVDSYLGLQNLVLTDITSVVSGSVTGYTSTTDIIVGGKFGQDSLDFFQYYASVLTAGCFVAFNLSTSAAVTIASAVFSVVTVTGQSYYYGKFRLSAAPTSTNIVQIKSAAPSVVNAVIPNANVITEIVNINADGQNAALHTFA